MKKVFKFGCLGVVGFVILIGILGAIVGGNRSSTSTTTAAQPTTASAAQSVAQSDPQQNEQVAPTAAPQPTAAPEPTPAPSVGQDVQVDQVRWKILSAEDLGNTLKSDNQFVKDKTTPGRFIKVRFEMENLSKDMLSFAGFDLVDNQERAFKSSSDAFSFVPTEEACVLENLNPNVAKTCTTIYEVPANAAELKAQVGDLKLFGGKSEMIDLGL